MRSFILTTFLFCVFATQSFSQSTGSISGGVRFAIDTSSKQQATTVALLRARDSAVIKLTIADRAGEYLFEKIKPGKYLIVASAVGHRKTHAPVFELKAEETSVRIKTIELFAMAKSLAEVTVTAKRPLIEHRIDRTVVNVDASVSNLGTTALDVLEKSPGVTVDNDGNISLKGKEGVLILVDGRPTQLNGADLAAMLRNMNSGQMDQVEIMTNPPARYDAAGNAGIINIKTKKNTASGYNGSINLTFSQGRYPKASEGFNFNYKAGKTNWFANLSHGYQRNFETLTIQRTILNSNGTAPANYFDQTARKSFESRSYNGKAGVDYTLSKKATLGLVLTGASAPSSVNNRNTTDILNSSKQAERVTTALVANNSAWKSFGANLNYRKQIDTKGREFTAEADYIGYDAVNNQFMENAYFDASANGIAKADTLTGRLPQVLNIYSARADYVHPLKKGFKLETGLKSSYVKTDNDAVYDSIQYGAVVHDYLRSNHFVYEENINAAYLNLSGPLTKKISAQFGLRLENTNATGHQLTTGANFSRNYTQLFPTGYLQYKANAKNIFGANYGRRIRRPNYQSLNPFIRFVDRYTYSEGNPNLKPQFSNNFEIFHSYGTILSTTINYTSTRDIIQGVIEQKGQEAYSRPANIASLRQFGIAVSVNTPFTKWWSGNLYVNAFNNSFKGVVNNAPIAFSAPGVTFSGTQQFKLSKTFTGELTGMYRSSRVEGVFKIKPVGVFTAGLSKQIMKNQGTVRLTFRDIFYTLRQNTVINYGNVDVAFQAVRDSRVISIGFSYRFSKGKAAAQKKKSAGSAGDEQERIDLD
ncbi:MAG: TonB-dependent receptor [Gemmatimonadaceae bacterium]|nr:TonB-dependent receptor [Chitinophagaceae bacterium]